MEAPPNSITFQPLGEAEPMPYPLLLLADPSKEMVDAYLSKSEVFTAKRDGQLLGIIVLTPIDHDNAEIKNVAVHPDAQRQGIGSFLITNAIRMAAAQGRRGILIGTADSSIGQLALYQNLGFRIVGKKVDFFLHNYGEPIFEGGIRARDMIILRTDIPQP